VKNAKTILVVDDNNFMLKLVKNMLEDEGHNVMTAKNGQAACTISYHYFPDLILLDRRLKNSRGDDVLRVLRNNDRTQNIPVAFLSAESGHRQILGGIALGADDYISKPFQKETLLKKVAALLNGRRNTGHHNISYV